MSLEDERKETSKRRRKTSKPMTVAECIAVYKQLGMSDIEIYEQLVLDEQSRGRVRKMEYDNAVGAKKELGLDSWWTTVNFAQWVPGACKSACEGCKRKIKCRVK